MSKNPQLHFPAGFRFHPTDEELVIHYLAKKAESKPFPMPVIAEVDLYKFSPWDLPEKAYFGEKEWYFFTPRDRKYPNGSRPNRAASSGYWKATGTDKPIYSRGKRVVGVKKALVFYHGKATKGVKSNWIMHEYRLAESGSNNNSAPGSKKFDDWVLCRIYEKTTGAFKVMVPAHRLEQPWPEPQPEVDPDEYAEAEVGEEESGVDEMLASLPDVDPSKLALPQLGIRMAESLENLHNSHNSKLALSDYWSLYSQGRFFTAEAVLQQMQAATRKTEFDGNDSLDCHASGASCLTF